jgi:hypothetical protein
MRQPDNLPAFCRVHRNGRPLIGVSIGWPEVGVHVDLQIASTSAGAVFGLLTLFPGPVSVAEPSRPRFSEGQEAAGQVVVLLTVLLTRRCGTRETQWRAGNGHAASRAGQRDAPFRWRRGRRVSFVS